MRTTLFPCGPAANESELKAFAHLSIFVQRLVREDEHEMLAWNPMQDEVIYKLSATIENTQEGAQQRIVLSSHTQGGRA
jgi:hypothetical protein